MTVYFKELLEEPIAQLLRQYRFSLIPRTGAITDNQLAMAIVTSFLLEHREKIQADYEKVLLGQILPLTHVPGEPDVSFANLGLDPPAGSNGARPPARAAALSFVQRACRRGPKKHRAA